LDELTTQVKFLEHEVEHLKKKLAESQEVQCSALSTHHSGGAADGLPAAEVKAETIVEITAEAPAEADTATAYIECRLPSSEGFYDIHPVWTKVCEFLQISELGRLSLGKKHSNFQKFFKAELHLYRKRKDKASDDPVSNNSNDATALCGPRVIVFAQPLSHHEYSNGLFRPSSVSRLQSCQVMKIHNRNIQVIIYNTIYYIEHIQQDIMKPLLFAVLLSFTHDH